MYEIVVDDQDINPIEDAVPSFLYFAVPCSSPATQYFAHGSMDEVIWFRAYVVLVQLQRFDPIDAVHRELRIVVTNKNRIVHLDELHEI